MERKHWVVSGRVQGVGFRAWVLGRAHELALSGWVRNTPDGHVEVEAGGPADNIARFERLLRRGPRHAHVTSCSTLPPGVDTSLSEPFEIRRD